MRQQRNGEWLRDLAAASMILLIGAGSALADPATLLVDDFSGIDAYTRDSFVNPYHAQAGMALWCAPTCPQTPPTVLGDQAFHTNVIGYYTSGHTDQGASNFVSYGSSAGAMVFVWDNRPNKYWYTALSKNPAFMNLTPYRYLSFRVKGKLGGEDFKLHISISHTGGFEREVRLSNYVTVKPDNQLATDWQTVRIPLTDLVSPNFMAQAASITFNFDNPRPSNATETIFVDDILFEADPAFRPVPDGVVKPVSTGRVKASARQLYVDGVRFFIRGIGYSPVAIGQTPDFGTYKPFPQAVVQRDFPNLRDMGINTVRVWSRFDYEQTMGTTALTRTYDNRNLLQYGADPFNIKVCAGFWVPYEISFANEWAKDRVAAEFQQFVAARKNEPSILMWVVGNENNVQNGYDWRWYQFANRLAKSAYQTEGATYHPVAFVEADLGTLNQANLTSKDANLNYIDIVGVNAYRGKDWEPFVTTAAQKTAKPIWLSEFGIDAWHSNSLTQPEMGQENQAEQADYLVKSLMQFARYQYDFAGSTVMEYSDEWWKSHQWPAAEIAAHLLTHDYKGFNFAQLNPNALPDGFMNEEWWGVMAIEPVAGSVDRVIPRRAFYELYSPTVGALVRNEASQPVANVTLNLYLGSVIAPAALVGTATTDAYGLCKFTELRPDTLYLLVMMRNGQVATKIGVSAKDASLPTVITFFQPTQLPDLIITSVAASASSSAAGSSLSLSAGVRNQGAGVAKGATVSFWFSRDAVLDAGDTLLDGNGYVGDSSPGASALVQASSKVPAGLSGTYFVCAKADSGDSNLESNEANNTACSAAPVFQAGGKAELSISALSAAGSPIADRVARGGTLRVNYTLANTGGLSVSRATVGFVLSANRTVGDLDDRVLWQVDELNDVGGPSSQARTVNLTVTTADGTFSPLGGFFVCAVADPAGKVDESNETNNTTCTTGMVVVY